MKNVNINFRVSADEKREFYIACATNGVEPSNVLRRMMRDYSAGRIEYPVKQQQQ